MENKDDFLAAIEKDPFKINDIADYEVIEFTARKTSKALNFLQQY